jgi:hypothetical protein
VGTTHPTGWRIDTATDDLADMMAMLWHLKIHERCQRSLILTDTNGPCLSFVMPGLVPGIHVLKSSAA